MKKLTTLFYCFIYCLLSAHAQQDLQYRIILIGDAGEINSTQQAIINDAVSKAVPRKTIALFLGDNVYPRGIELTAEKKAASQNVLRSQFENLRKNGVPVYFVPGNHDWDKSGPRGYEKIIAANNFFYHQQDSLLQMIPADGCPGPYELPVTDNLLIVAMDSEWWLYPYDKQTDASDCPCKTKRDVLGKLSDILQRNRNKTIIFATHHPFNTYGTHGGYYTLKEHVFPLTDLNKNLYIPLPVIGSLYPILRKTFPPAEDPGNVLYRDMKTAVEDILKTHPNVLHVAGHEHTLQLIQGAVLQVVSGAGCKDTPVRKGKGSLYAADSSGYVLADILTDNSLRLHYLTYGNNRLNESFVFNRSYTAAPVTDDAISNSDLTGDSIRLRLIPAFDKVSNTHRGLFGENYRKAWAVETSLPVFRLSATDLSPTERGGGMQTHSLRLTDKNNDEWVIRSIDKFPDALLPEVLNQTLAAKLLHDNVSAIFPYAPLTVPVFANALGIPHANPKIVYVAPDKKLGIYSRDFANTVVLLEEREPLGKSSSTIKMQEKLKEDNDNSIDQQSFLTARLQDIFLGDWDRHGDQWRWVDDAKGKAKRFKPVPRDRDQVFYINQGLLPYLLALPWIMPKFQGFSGHIRDINSFAFNARLIDGIFTNALSYEDWMNTTRHVVNTLTDSVIAAALQKMPASVYHQSHTSLQDLLQKRRQDLLRVMPVYYRFLNKNIDILLSDKNEQVNITDTADGKLQLIIFKITKNNEISRLLYSRTIDPAVTRELRLYMYGGDDNIHITNNSSPVTIRIIGDGLSDKQYVFNGKTKYLRKVHVYEADSSAVFSGQTGPVHKHLSDDPDNTAMQLANRYNKTIPLISAGYNVDDGFILGAGIRWIRQGFRKTPFANTQQFLFGHSFSTDAFRFTYKGEWMHVMGKTDITLQANAFAPDNTQNFYGRGNASVFDKTGDFKSYYRTRFNFYELNPSFRWRTAKGNSFSLGPALQYYRFETNDNAGRFINNTTLLHSYDSNTVANDKAHAGLIAVYNRDSRNNALLPVSGNFVNLKWQGYSGLNSYSKTFMQLTAQIAVVKSIDRKSNIVIANRIGGGITAGKATFYQSLFLGGQNNLQGYRQYRFAGEHMLYNNFEARIKLANLASYVLPGQLGIVGFYDIGKVWQKGYNDKKWHQGVGGGFYFAPARMLVLQLVAGYSPEGWYPYFTMGFRF
ncbi:MAG: BamA/TamA family outer membrane protein [Chitinophagaceae bacterium]